MLAARNRFIGPSRLISNSRLVCCAQFQRSRRADGSPVTFANHYAIPAIYEVREICRTDAYRQISVHTGH